jgi:hypothetical protein
MICNYPESEKIEELNSFCTVFETKAVINYNGEKFIFKINDILNVRILKKRAHTSKLFLLIFIVLILFITYISVNNNQLIRILMSLFFLYFIGFSIISKSNTYILLVNHKFAYNEFVIEIENVQFAASFVNIIKTKLSLGI